jgi:tetratricopeptide (TPR) repeat protein
MIHPISPVERIHTLEAGGFRVTEFAQPPARRLKQFQDDPANAYANTEASVNALGYRLMNANRLDEAIEIFKLNVEAFPRAWNVYDSLGEAYMKKGNRELAIKNYEKSLELNPQNGGARDALHRLRAK